MTGKVMEAAVHCLKYMADIEVCEECPVYRNGDLACREVARYALSALEEIQQYREIGTVEECRAAMCNRKRKGSRCEECLFFEDRVVGRNGGMSGICRIKPQNGRRYGKSAACRFFEKDYERQEE